MEGLGERALSRTVKTYAERELYDPGFHELLFDPARKISRRDLAPTGPAAKKYDEIDEPYHSWKHVTLYRFKLPLPGGGKQPPRRHRAR